MKKKIIIFLLAFVVVIGVYTPNRSEAAAPDRIPYSTWADYRGQYVFISVWSSIYNATYRGYLSVGNCLTYCNYSGYLYRDPLPYPLPIP